MIVQVCISTYDADDQRVGVFVAECATPPDEEVLKLLYDLVGSDSHYGYITVHPSNNPHIVLEAYEVTKDAEKTPRSTD